MLFPRAITSMNITGLEFCIGALACYRLTVLLARDDGPFMVFHKLRGNSKLLKCPRCASVYCGAFVTFCIWLAGMKQDWPIYPLLTLAFSGVAIALDRTFTSA